MNSVLVAFGWNSSIRPSKGLNSFSLSVSENRGGDAVRQALVGNLLVTRDHCLPGPFQAVTSISIPKKSFPLDTVRAFSWSSCCLKNTRPYRSSDAP